MFPNPVPSQCDISARLRLPVPFWDYFRFFRQLSETVYTRVAPFERNGRMMDLSLWDSHNNQSNDLKGNQQKESSRFPVLSIKPDVEGSP